MCALQHRWCCGMGRDPAARPDSLESLRGATEQLRLSILAEEWQLGASEAVSMSARGVYVCVCVWSRTLRSSSTVLKGPPSPLPGAEQLSELPGF